MAHQEDKFQHALSSNSSWASYRAHQDPEYFKTLSQGQSPEILWLGCSDSRVPETTLLGLQPGEVFVHRNIANIINAADINSSAVIEYAVAHLKVKHIVLAGHTSCGGVAAALAEGRVGGVLDTWLAPLKGVAKTNKQELEAIVDSTKRAVRLVELNVKLGVEVLLRNHIVDEAIAERGLQVHGVVLDLTSGKLNDLHCGNEKAFESISEVSNIDKGVIADSSS